MFGKLPQLPPDHKNEDKKFTILHLGNLLPMLLFKGRSVMPCLKDFLACFPYDDILTRFTIKGYQLKKIFSHIMRKENRNSEGECYQVNSKVKAIYSDKEEKLISLKIDSNEVEDDKEYTICMQNYHYGNCQAYLNISPIELNASGKTKVITTCAQQVLEEHFRNHPNSSSKVEGRLEYRK